jgi:hypothetical protein
MTTTRIRRRMGPRRTSYCKPRLKAQGGFGL